MRKSFCEHYRCFKAKSILDVIDEGDSVPDTSDTAWVNLFQREGSSNILSIGDGSMEVEVNPTGAVSGFPQGLQCGSGYLYPGREASRGNNSESIGFAVEDSPRLSLSFWNVRPSCLLGVCDFNWETSIQPFVNSSSGLLKEMYPTNPENVEINSNSDWVVESNGGPTASLGKVKEICLGYEKGAECYHSWASEMDLLKVRTAGLMADGQNLFLNRKYIGVVPKAGFASSSYFESLNERLPEAGRPYLKGVTSFNVSDAVLVQSDFPVGLPHELVHSLDIKFDNSDIFDRIHQPRSKHASGYSVSLFNEGLRIKNIISFMQPSVGPDFWMDADAYSKISNRLKGLPQRRKFIDGDELLINGAINSRGEFISAGMYTGLKAGLSSGESAGNLQIYTYDPSGAVVSQSSIPYRNGLILESDTEAYPLDTSFAAVSTGIPYSQNVLRISAAPIGKMTASVKSYYPSVEILRTNIENIPSSAFIGDAVSARENLWRITDDTESLLSKGDLTSALRKVQNSLKPLVISSLKGSFDRESSLDVGRNDFLASIFSVATQYEFLIESFPNYQNDLLRVIEGAPQDGRIIFNIKALKLPTRKDYEYIVSAFLDGMPQRIEIKKRGLEWKARTPVLVEGEHSISFSLFIQDTRLAKSLEKAIDQDEYEILLQQRELDQTTDPALRDEIQKRIGELSSRLSSSRQRLLNIRIPLGEPLTIQFSPE